MKSIEPHDLRFIERIGNNTRRVVINYRKLVMLLFAILIVGCINKSKDNDPPYIPSVQRLVDQGKRYAALKIQDSLISKNNKNGNLYLGRADLEIALLDFERSISDLKKAYALNYKKELCLKKIAESEQIIREMKSRGTFKILKKTENLDSLWALDSIKHANQKNSTLP